MTLPLPPGRRPRYTPRHRFRPPGGLPPRVPGASAPGLGCWRAQSAVSRETPMQDFGPMKMTFDELEDFLVGNPPTPAYVAVATVRRDGSPFVAPVGFLYENG